MAQKSLRINCIKTCVYLRTMSRFKPRTSKVLEDDTQRRVTLDTKHTSVLSAPTACSHRQSGAVVYSLSSFLFASSKLTKRFKVCTAQCKVLFNNHPSSNWYCPWRKRLKTIDTKRVFQTKRMLQNDAFRVMLWEWGWVVG